MLALEPVHIIVRESLTTDSAKIAVEIESACARSLCSGTALRLMLRWNTGLGRFHELRNFSRSPPVSAISVPRQCPGKHGPDRQWLPRVVAVPPAWPCACEIPRSKLVVDLLRARMQSGRSREFARFGEGRDRLPAFCPTWTESIWIYFTAFQFDNAKNIGRFCKT